MPGPTEGARCGLSRIVRLRWDHCTAWSHGSLMCRTSPLTFWALNIERRILLISDGPLAAGGSGSHGWADRGEGGS